MQPNWGFEIAFFVADGEPVPDVPWPDNWEVCSVPDFDPFCLPTETRRHGSKWLAWPKYSVENPIIELNAICAFFDRMTPSSIELWRGLKDRFVSMSCGDLEMDSSHIGARGFFVPPETIQSIRGLGIRLRIGFHPGARIRWDMNY